MRTGFKGAFVISWAQTELDGLRGVEMGGMSAGTAWRWHGESVRIDGPQGLLVLGDAIGMANLRAGAARKVRKFFGDALGNRKDLRGVDLGDVEPDYGFILPNGMQTYGATLIDLGAGSPPLLVFQDQIPPQDTDLWVVSANLPKPEVSSSDLGAGGVICFAKGTQILTDNGQVAVEDLTEGDRLQTKDDGAQEIHWIGQRKMSGARLHAMPHLRPIRIKKGALDLGEPDKDLLISPEHRVLIKGRGAQALFNTDEVLVTARDLLNDRSILIDHSLKDVTYYHLMLDRHQIVWANGVECESFHPANTSLQAIENTQRDRLFSHFPALQSDAFSYGDYARRNLSRSDAAILQYDRFVHR